MLRRQSSTGVGAPSKDSFILEHHKRFNPLYKTTLSEVALSKVVPEVSAWRTGDEAAVWEDQSSEFQHFIFFH